MLLIFPCSMALLVHPRQHCPRGPSSGGGLPKFCARRTTWALLGQAQALPTLFACPRSCLGMHDWGPIGPVQSFAWACSSCGKPDQLLGHAQSGTPSRKVGKPKSWAWASPSTSAQPAWARMWQAQISPSPARVQPKQNADWDVSLHVDLPKPADLH